MTRIHYRSRPVAARPGRAYTGSGHPVPLPAREQVPVTDGLVECPECGGGVRVVGLPYADKENDIPYKASVYGRHIRGGGKPPRGGTAVCPAVYTAIKP